MTSEQVGYESRSDKVQISARFDRRLLKVLKGAAEYLDMSFSDLLESMAVTALQGDCIFGPDALKQIEQLQSIYGFDKYLDAIGDAAEAAEASEEGDKD